MVSPAQNFYRESLSTLNFATACKSIVNEDKITKYKSQISHIAFVKQMPKAKKFEVPWQGLKNTIKYKY